MSDAERSGTRRQEHTVEIRAPAAAVWRAITEAEEVTRWYVQEAEIDPRPGGTYRVSWGEGMEGISDIVAFEPDRRLRVEHRPMPGAPEMAAPIAEEYTIESEGGVTVLRLVTSGIPDTEDWDWFYEGTERGWTIFLLGLRHYLERHPGKPRDQVATMVGLPDSLAEGWSRLVGPEGLGLADEVADASAGDRYAARTAFGEELAGELLMLDPPHRLLATVEDLDDGLLSATLEEMGGRNFLHLSLGTFGLEPDTFERVKARWESWLDDLFPGEAPAEAFQKSYGEPASTPD
ncbi:MAG: SRPBCC domain-containing protein [Gemmatimonadota bacterium]|nr:SRPBCC domain-containing protein [Gemmatimonadota bacterium]